MQTPVFLNESRALGDLRLFESVDALREHVEPIDVERGEYFALDAEGRLLALRADRDTTSASRRSSLSPDTP